MLLTQALATFLALEVTMNNFDATDGGRLLSHPFFIAEIFTSTPGKFMNLATIISDFNEVLSGN